MKKVTVYNRIKFDKPEDSQYILPYFKQFPEFKFVLMGDTHYWENHYDKGYPFSKSQSGLINIKHFLEGVYTYYDEVFVRSIGGTLNAMSFKLDLGNGLFIRYQVEYDTATRHVFLDVKTSSLSPDYSVTNEILTSSKQLTTSKSNIKASDFTKVQLDIIQTLLKLQKDSPRIVVIDSKYSIYCLGKRSENINKRTIKALLDKKAIVKQGDNYYVLSKNMYQMTIGE